MLLLPLLCMASIMGVSLCSSREVVGLDISTLGYILDLSLRPDGTCKVVSLQADAACDNCLCFTDISFAGVSTSKKYLITNLCRNLKEIDSMNYRHMAACFSSNGESIIAWLNDDNDENINLFFFKAESGEAEGKMRFPFKTIYQRYNFSDDHRVSGGKGIVYIDYHPKRDDSEILFAYGVGCSYRIKLTPSCYIEEEGTIVPPFHRLSWETRSIIMGKDKMPSALEEVRKRYKKCVPQGSVLISCSADAEQGRKLVYNRHNSSLDLLNEQNGVVSSLTGVSLGLSRYKSDQIKHAADALFERGRRDLSDGHCQLISIDKRLFLLPQVGNMTISKKQQVKAPIKKPSSSRWLLRPRTIGLVVGVAVTTATCFYAWQYLRAPLRALP